MKRIRLWLLLLLVVGVAGFIIFAIWSEQRRIATLATFSPTPELLHHAALAEAMKAGNPESASPELQPELRVIARWTILLQRAKKEDDRLAWDALVKLWREAENWDTIPEADRARILRFLDEHRDYLADLREVTALGGPIQPAPLVPPGPAERNHTFYAREWGDRLALDCVARARTGESETAVNDAVAGMQLCDALALEPTHVSQLSRLFWSERTHAAIMEAFPPGVLTRDDTMRIVRQAQSAVGRDMMLVGLQDSHRESLNDYYAPVLDLGWGDRYYELTVRLGRPAKLFGQLKLLAYASPVAEPWLNRDLEDLAEAMKYTDSVAALKPYEARASDAVYDAEMAERSLGPIARNYHENSASSMLRYQADLEVRLQLIQIGLVLELFQNERGAPPDSLEAAASALPAATFIDPYSGEPFVYRRERGAFVLYSVAMNQIDDGGAHDPVQGDIVWRGTWRR